MFEPDPNDPTLGQAAEALAQMEKELDSDATDAPSTPEPAKESATPEQRAAQPEQKQVQATESDSKEPGAQATEEQQKTEQGSKFAKNQARLQGGWNKLNEEKAALQKEREAIEAAKKEAAEAQRIANEAKEKASQPKYKPEDYEELGKYLTEQADTLESAGKFDEADDKRSEAKRAVEYAKHLRANPPPAPKTNEQARAEFQKLQKEWYGKALVDFPNIAKKDSEEFKALAALIQSEPAVVNDPKGMYYAARLVTAEASAARASNLEKETVALRAKVKELEGQLAIPGDGIAVKIGHVKPDSEKTDEELEADLQKEAAQRDGRF